MNFNALQKLNVALFTIGFCYLFLPFVSFASASDLVIDEFRTRSVTDTLDEYIVIANYGTDPIDLDGYSLKKKTASLGSIPTLIHNFTGLTLNSNEKITITQSLYSGSATLADTNNIIILYDDKTPANIVDCVAYGTVNFPFVEGTALSNPAKGIPYKRVLIPESNDNSLDFELYIPIIPPDINADKLVISELLPSPKDGEEWFELYNPTNLNISLANLKICDVMGSRRCYLFDKLDFMSAGSYKIYPQTLTKITLNNSGDWLELYDSADNFLTDSGGNYEAADKGVSLALFGSEYHWTTTPTPGGQNVFTDIVEIEKDSKPVTKTTKSKVVKSSTKTSAKTLLAPITEAAEVDEPAVKAAKTTTNGVTSVITRKTLGWILIGLAFLLLVGYTLWYFRNYAKNIYDKIRRRDDSARF